MYIYVYICVCTYVNIRIHDYVHLFMHSYVTDAMCEYIVMFTDMDANTCVYDCVRICTRMHVCMTILSLYYMVVRVCVRERDTIFIHVYMHMRICQYICDIDRVCM